MRQYDGGVQLRLSARSLASSVAIDSAAAVGTGGGTCWARRWRDGMPTLSLANRLNRSERARPSLDDAASSGLICLTRAYRTMYWLVSAKLHFCTKMPSH